LLNPNDNNAVPEEGEDIPEHLAKTYGPIVAARMASHETPVQLGRDVGIQFATKRNIYPTVMAHALMEHVKQTSFNSSNQAANRFMEDLYKSYFEQGANINDVETLADIAAKSIGMDKAQAKQACCNVDLWRLVRQKDAEYKTRKGISGVPFFIFHQNSSTTPDIALSGAQPPKVLAQQIKKAAATAAATEHR
jgi:predicted DsbA family dithiol-disulfide isomerase